METKTYSTTKDVLMAVPLPKETRTYKPVGHGQLIDLTLESIHKAGFELESERYSTSNDGNISNGKFKIKNVADSEMQLQIGWQNSYNKKLTLKFAIGTNVFICQNGCVSGDYGSFKKKHVGEIMEFAPAAIIDYIKRAGDGFKKMQDERDIMKTYEVSDRVKAELIGRMFIEEQFISSTQLNIIKNELVRPTYDYKAENTLWELYNHTTHAMKELHPTLWMQSHIDAHNFFVKTSGIVVKPSSEFTLAPPELVIDNQIEMFDTPGFIV